MSEFIVHHVDFSKVTPDELLNFTIQIAFKIDKTGENNFCTAEIFPIHAYICIFYLLYFIHILYSCVFFSLFLYCTVLQSHFCGIFEVTLSVIVCLTFELNDVAFVCL